MKKNLYLAVFLMANALLAQEVKFGDVDKTALEERQYALDSTADAVVLYKNRDTYIVDAAGEWQLRTEVHRRVKIYNTDGFDEATGEIYLYKNKSLKETVGKIKAVTYNLENGKVVETPLEKDQIFTSEYSYNYNQVKFTMPKVKEGSIIEFTYTTSSPIFWSIDEFKFQEEIPVKRMHAEIRTPEGFRFNQMSKGGLPFRPEVSTKMDNRLHTQVKVQTYDMQDIPALKEESYVDNMDNYRAGVMFELVSIEFPGYFKSFSQTWNDVAKTIGNSDDYKNQLDKSNSFSEELDALLEGKTDPKEKMAAVFHYVKSQITWNGMDGKYFFNGLKKTLKEKKGNAADVNLLLVGMLRYAGLDANPVIISTKDNAVPLFPTIERLNYVIAYVQDGEEHYFLDATDKYSDINVLPIKDYNWQGILIDNNKKRWDLISLNSPDAATKMLSLTVAMGDDGSAEGKFGGRYSNHSAMELREASKDQDEETYLTEMETAYDGIEISEYQAQNKDHDEGTISETFDLFYENASEMVDDKMYVYPMLFLRKEENPFKLEKREFPVDFGYPFKNRYIVNITLPEGYTIESQPEPALVKLPDDLGQFKYIVRVQGNIVNLLVDYSIDQALVSMQNYPFLREFYSQMIAKEAEPLVLVKS